MSSERALLGTEPWGRRHTGVQRRSRQVSSPSERTVSVLRSATSTESQRCDCVRPGRYRRTARLPRKSPKLLRFLGHGSALARLLQRKSPRSLRRAGGVAATSQVRSAIMPGANRTGPMGQGPRTGWGMGWCAGAGARMAPMSRGAGCGMGWGRGRGGGWGQRHGYRATGLTSWQRAQGVWSTQSSASPGQSSKTAVALSEGDSKARI